MARPLPMLIVLTGLLLVLGSVADATEQRGREPALPFVRVDVPEPIVLELAYDEMELVRGLAPVAAGGHATGPLAGLKHARLITRQPGRATLELRGTHDVLALGTQLAAAEAANSGWRALAVLYEPRFGRSPAGRHLLTRQVAFALAPDADPHRVLAGAQFVETIERPGSVDRFMNSPPMAAPRPISAPRAIPGVPSSYVVDTRDPLAALALADALRRRTDVRRASAVLVASATEPRAVEREPKRERRKDRAVEGGWDAHEYAVLRRAPPGRTDVPVERYEAAIAAARRLPRYSTRAQALVVGEPPIGLDTWTPLGPGNIGGRTRAILVDPLTPTTMVAAGVTGGIWRTLNGGVSWTPVGDLLANINVVTLAMDPGNPAVIYAGTGERIGSAGRGAGIFKTADAGTTWSRLAVTNTADFRYVNKVAVSPDSSQRLYAGTSTGVWRSLDAGATWTRVLSAGDCMDLVIRTDQPADVVFAACGLGVGSAVYRNVDAGGQGTWESVLTETGMGRTALALAPSRQSTVYAVAGSTVAGPYREALHAVFRSESGGETGTWTPRVRNTDPAKRNTIILGSPVCDFDAVTDYSAQASYDLVIGVDPLDPERVWVGGIHLFRSDDGGVNGAGPTVLPPARSTSTTTSSCSTRTTTA